MGQSIGIDFGTTNTVVSFMDSRGHLHSIEDNNGNILIPTAIFFNSESEYIIGRRAKNKGRLKPAALVENFKTRLSETRPRPYRGIAANGDRIRIEPARAMALFLNRLIRDINDKLQADADDLEEGKIDRAVITVPTKFNSRAIEEIKIAAMNALAIDKEYIKAVFEPTAAARADHENEKEKNGETVLIYDFGGGTFDVSVMRYENFSYKEIYTDGYKDLGGNNLTQKLAEKLLNDANDEYDTEYTMNASDYDPEFNISEEQYNDNIDAVWDAAEKAKIALSDEDIVKANFNFWHTEGKEVISDNYRVSVTKQEFLDLVKDDLKKTVDKTVEVISAAKSKIDRVVMAGGTSRIGVIRDLLAEGLNRDDIKVSDEAETIISRGAALFSGNMQDIDAVTEQVTKNEVGVAGREGVIDNKFIKILDAGVKLPASTTHLFSLLHEESDSLRISYYEKDARNYPKAEIGDEVGIEEVADLYIKFNEKLKRADTMVEVTFSAQKDGTLQFAARVLDKAGNEKGSAQIITGRDSDLK